MSSTPEPGTPNPRILIFSQRGYNFKAWQTLFYEFEDVIRAVDDAAIVSPIQQVNSRLRAFVRRRRDKIRRSLGLYKEADVAPTRLNRDYELFFCNIGLPSQLPLLKTIQNLRQRCRRAVCFLGEFSSHRLEQEKRNLSILAELQFDYVFFPSPAALPTLRQFLGPQCRFLPVGVDCIRFSPYPNPPLRTIDCLSMGRRSEVTHQSLLQLAARGDFHYVYDTVSNFDVARYEEHRALTVNLIKRSRYFIGYSTTSLAGEKQGDDEMISARFFEGAAGGAAILGGAPACKEFRDLFDWPDAIVPIPVDCTTMGDVIAELDAQPQRVAALRHRSIVHCLARHDWGYRWEQILTAVGLKPAAALPERLSRLQELRRLAMASRDDTDTLAGAAH